MSNIYCIFAWMLLNIGDEMCHISTYENRIEGVDRGAGVRGWRVRNRG